MSRNNNYWEDEYKTCISSIQFCVDSAMRGDMTINSALNDLDWQAYCVRVREWPQVLRRLVNERIDMARSKIRLMEAGGDPNERQG